MLSPVTFNSTPFELLHKYKPNYTHLKVFGCACFPLQPPHSHNKLQAKARMCVFLGYSDAYKGYKCLDILTNKISISRHITFDENYFPFSSQHTQQPNASPDLPPSFLIPTSILPNFTSIPSSQHKPVSQPNNTATNHYQSPSNNLYQSSPVPHAEIPPPQSHRMITRTQTGSLKPIQRLNLLHSSSDSLPNNTPTTYAAASKFPEWRAAMNEEFLALQQQGTWSLVEPPAGAQVLGCRWTYRTKHRSDGSIAKYKARLVAQGNHQEFGVDYNETFSPVAKLPTIRVLLAVALHHDWQI
ncbi:hypothetical protein KFK09_010389 [Dendrobium nobile]|uniref:Retrovirus-related Pol polyprotein from transposon TNT 1-94 n=1 Tax=Dendrobium nobile TaxID=94219 RepID=A0A8T3BBL2_DENNO|nr:hypothetical protein KFK09_010389 [Dendrobium nobile]